MEAFFDVCDKLPALSQELEQNITGLKGEIRNLWGLRRSLKRGIRENFEAEVLKLVAIRARQHREVDRFIDTQVSALKKCLESLRIAQTEASDMCQANDLNSLRRVAAAIQSGSHDQKLTVSYYAGQTQPQSLITQEMDLVKFKVYKNITQLDVSFLTAKVTATPGNTDQEIEDLASESMEVAAQDQEDQNQKLIVSRGNGNSIHVFNVESGEYKLLVPDYELPDGTERYECLGDSILVLGGGREDVLKEVKEVDLTGKSKDLPNMSLGRSGLAIMILGKQLYAVGGQDGNYDILIEAERLELPNPTQWQSISPLNTPVRWGRCISYNDRILLLGGENAEDGYLDLVQEYSVPHDRWKTWEIRLPVGCRRLGAAMGDKEILIWGGETASGTSDGIYLGSGRVGSLPGKGEFYENLIVRSGYCYCWMDYYDSQSGSRIKALKLRVSDGSYQELQDVKL